MTITASENFIASVNAAMFNTLYETKKAALAIAKDLLATDTNINKAYPGVTEAEALIATVEADLKNDALFLFAYDDIESIQYFGENLKADIFGEIRDARTQEVVKLFKF